MKQLFLVFFISVQIFIADDALAWSPIDAFRSTVEKPFQCQWLIAASDEQQEGHDNNEDEEEEDEPDCD